MGNAVLVEKDWGGGGGRGRGRGGEGDKRMEENNGERS